MPAENVAVSNLDDDLTGSLARLVEFAPYKPYCSDNKTASQVLPFSIARNREYIQINQPTQVYWLIFDLDHPNPYIWDDLNLPPPNIITISPETGTSHICYAIEPVCISDKGSRKAIAYMKAVRGAYARALKADLDYSSPVTKNPLHPYWKVFCPTDYVYSLGELADYREIDLSSSNNFPSSKDCRYKDLEDPQGRNCTLFLRLRLWAYTEVSDARKDLTFESWDRKVFDKAERLNALIGREFSKGALKPSEVKATAKSVSGWTWTRYTGSIIDRGVMEMQNADIPLENKQRLSARRTHEIRREKTIEKIIAAARLLLTAQKPLSRTSIGELAKVSRQTVARYWRDVEALQDQWEEQSSEHKPIPSVDAAIRESLERPGNVVTLSTLVKNTGVHRKTIRSHYPALFDP